MKYLFLSGAENLVAWARTVVTQLVQRDAAVDARMKAIEDRLKAGNL